MNFASYIYYTLDLFRVTFTIVGSNNYPVRMRQVNYI